MYDPEAVDRIERQAHLRQAIQRKPDRIFLRIASVSGPALEIPLQHRPTWGSPLRSMSVRCAARGRLSCGTVQVPCNESLGESRKRIVFTSSFAVGRGVHVQVGVHVSPLPDLVFDATLRKGRAGFALGRALGRTMMVRSAVS